MEMNERCHVAAFRYRKAINDMADYIEDRLKTDFPDNPVRERFSYEVPREMTKEIPMFSSLNVEVNVFNMRYRRFIDDNGSAYLNRDEMVDMIYDRFENEVGITVNAQVSGNGVFYRETFVGTMVHELNHKYEQLCRMKAGKPRSVVTQLYGQLDFEKRLMSLPEGHFRCSPGTERYLRNILYCLFIDTEFHAEISSVYGDIAAFGEIGFEELSVYARYVYYRDGFDMLKSLSDETCVRIMDLMKDYSRSLGKCRTADAFRKKFILECEERLERFGRLIGDTYCFYRDFREEEERIGKEEGIPPHADPLNEMIRNNMIKRHERTNALTRKPAADMTGQESPLDINVPEDSSSFSKHSRLWYKVNNFINTTLPVFKESLKSKRYDFGNYGLFTDDDIDMLYELCSADRIDSDVVSLCDKHDVFALIMPKTMSLQWEMTKNTHSLNWMRYMDRVLKYKFRNEPNMFSLDFICDDGKVIPVYDWNGQGMPVALNICARNMQNFVMGAPYSFAIPIQGFFRQEMSFPEARHAAKNETMVVDGKHYHGSMMSNAEMDVMRHMIEYVDFALEMLGIDNIRFKGHKIWRDNGDVMYYETEHQCYLSTLTDHNDEKHTFEWICVFRPKQKAFKMKIGG